jgi:hypothetical protein
MAEEGVEDMARLHAGRQEQLDDLRGEEEQQHPGSFRALGRRPTPITLSDHSTHSPVSSLNLEPWNLDFCKVCTA